MVTINVTAQLRALHDSVDHLEQMNQALQMLAIFQYRLIKAYRNKDCKAVALLSLQLENFEDTIRLLEAPNDKRSDS